jgi:dinuclear metal center YbgI/SA1388 family protein
MPTVADIVDALETIAPARYAAEWDNVGLLIGSRQWKADSLLLTIDLTEAVLDEAIDHGTRMVIAYHPPIFEPLRRLSAATATERISLHAAREGIAVYSPHTALDAAPGGVNDWLASALGSGDVRALSSHEQLPETEQLKIVTFCPTEAVDKLRNGLASIGAGRIGNYELCSFELAGTGTFLGREGSNPSVGRRGHLERVGEVRLEMVCPRAALALAVTTLRQFHPYEEPPIEVYALQPRPLRGIGAGRRIVLDQKLSLKSVIQRLKSHLGVKQLGVALGSGASGRYGIVGLCAGAGGSLLPAAIEQGCELFITGELRHHDVLAAQGRGCTVVVAGHTNTERGYLPGYRKRIAELLEGVTIHLARRDADPLRMM